MFNSPARRKPRSRSNSTKPKYLYFNAAPDAVVGGIFALPSDISSLSAHFIDWGEEYTAKIPLAEIEAIKAVLAPAHLTEVLGGSLSSEGGQR